MLPNLLMAALQGVTRPFAKKGAPTLEQLERGEPIGLAQSMGYPQRSALMRQLYAEKSLQDPYYSIGGGMSAQRGKPNVFGMQQPTRGIPAQYAERLNPVTGMPETVMIDPGEPGTAGGAFSFDPNDPTSVALMGIRQRGGKYKDPQGNEFDIKPPPEPPGAGDKPAATGAPEVPGERATTGGELWKDVKGFGSSLMDAITDPATRQDLGTVANTGADAALNSTLVQKDPVLKYMTDPVGASPMSSWPGFGGGPAAPQRIPDAVLQQHSPQMQIPTIDQTVPASEGGATGAWEPDQRKGATGSWEAPPAAPRGAGATASWNVKPTAKPVMQEPMATEGDVDALLKVAKTLPPDVAAEAILAFTAENTNLVVNLPESKQEEIADVLVITKEEWQSLIKDLKEAGKLEQPTPAAAPIPRLPVMPQGNLNSPFMDTLKEIGGLVDPLQAIKDIIAKGSAPMQTDTQHRMRVEQMQRDKSNAIRNFYQTR